MTIGALPCVVPVWCCMASQAVGKASMVEGDHSPAILIVAVGAGAAIMARRCGMTALAIDQLFVG